MGRTAIPTQIHRLAGTFRADRHGGTEPEPSGDVGDAPEHLDAEAVAEWQRLEPILTGCNVLTAADRGALAGHCAAWSRWIAAELAIKETGVVVKSPSGFPILNPHLSVANRALDEMRRWGNELGLSPAARTK